MLRHRLWFSALISLGLLLAIGATPLWSLPPSQNKTEGPARIQLEQAKALLQGHKPLPAVEMLENLIAAFPLSASVPEAYLLLGQTLSTLRNTDEANTYYRRLLEEYPASEFAPQARLGLALGLVAIGQQDAAIPLLIEAKEQAQDSAAKLTILRQLEEIFFSKHDTLRAVEYSVEGRGLAPDDVRPQFEGRIRDLVNKQASERDLRRIAERFPRGFPGDLALLRLMDLYAGSGEDHKARRAARDFLTRFPKHELAATATDTLAGLRKRVKAKGTIIGALLPLSGSMGTYGNDVLQGIKIALDEAAEAKPPLAVGLVAKDTEGDPQRLMSELDDLLMDYRPVAVIGPLLTRDVKAVAPFAEANEVVFITPTATLTEVQRFSRYLFNTAVNNRSLLHELALYATGSRGWKRFCVLAPRDAYGSEMTQVFSEEIRRLGGEIVATDTYGADDMDFGAPIKRIMAQDLKRNGKMEPATKKGKNIKVYVPGFDAIFLPGEAGRVGLIAGQVPFYAAKVGLLGSNGMNSEELIRIGGRAVEDAVFADSFSVDSPDPAVRDFVERYTKQFQEPPTAFAAQAYEATRLVLDAIRRGATTGRALRENVKSARNLPGLAGMLTMSPTGHLERPYDIMQVKNGKFVSIPYIPLSEAR